jgi:hypothetical protein
LFRDWRLKHGPQCCLLGWEGLQYWAVRFSLLFFFRVSQKYVVLFKLVALVVWRSGDSSILLSQNRTQNSLPQAGDELIVVELVQNK